MAAWLTPPVLLMATAIGAGALAWLARGAAITWPVARAVAGGQGSVEGVCADLRFGAASGALALAVVACVFLPFDGVIARAGALQQRVQDRARRALRDDDLLERVAAGEPLDDRGRAHEAAPSRGVTTSRRARAAHLGPPAARSSG